jgi:hypothetical protein
MAHHEFNDLKQTAAALPSEQIQQLRDELDRKLAERAAAGTPVEGGKPDADPLLGLWRKRREEAWREFDL